MPYKKVFVEDVVKTALIAEIGMQVVYTGLGAFPSQHEMVTVQGVKVGDILTIKRILRANGSQTGLDFKEIVDVHNSSMFIPLSQWVTQFSLV